MRDREIHRKLRDDSDELMDLIHELHDLEAEKRKTEMSSDRFHSLADRVKDISDSVFRIAADQKDLGGDLGPPQDITIDEVPEGESDLADADHGRLADETASPTWGSDGPGRRA